MSSINRVQTDTCQMSIPLFGRLLDTASQLNPNDCCGVSSGVTPGPYTRLVGLRVQRTTIVVKRVGATLPPPNSCEVIYPCQDTGPLEDVLATSSRAGKYIKDVEIKYALVQLRNARVVSQNSTCITTAAKCGFIPIDVPGCPHPPVSIPKVLYLTMFNLLGEPATPGVYDVCNEFYARSYAMYYNEGVWNAGGGRYIPPEEIDPEEPLLQEKYCLFSATFGLFAGSFPEGWDWCVSPIALEGFLSYGASDFGGESIGGVFFGAELVYEKSSLDPLYLHFETPHDTGAGIYIVSE